MLIEGGVTAAILVAARFADQHSTEQFKDTARKWIKDARLSEWQRAVSNSAYTVYVSIFDSQSSSIKFSFRSSIVYISLICFSFIFLKFFFYSTYVSITSVWHDGTSIEKLFWAMCILLGGVLYILANAQTLYFLEILRTTPTFFDFFLLRMQIFLLPLRYHCLVELEYFYYMLTAAHTSPRHPFRLDSISRKS